MYDYGQNTDILYFDLVIFPLISSWVVSWPPSNEKAVESEIFFCLFLALIQTRYMPIYYNVYAIQYLASLLCTYVYLYYKEAIFT